MFLRRVYLSILTWTAVLGTLKLHESSTCISWPQKFSFAGVAHGFENGF